MQYSIVNYSKISEHPEFRIDAECFKPYHLEVEQSIVKKGFGFIKDHATSVINFGAYSLCNYIEFLDSGKPFLVTEDIKNNVIEIDNLHFISDYVHSLLHKSHCVKGQVLLTMAGAYLGQAAVFSEDFECSSNQAIAKISLHPNSINPYYLSTFLNCRYGQSQILRFRTGTGQPNLNLGLIKLIRVAEASDQFQQGIDQEVNAALDLRRKSSSIYNQAQTILLSELGLANWRPRHRLWFVKNYSDIEQAERIDAEYYQPKYEEIVNAIVGYSGSYSFIKDEFKQNKSTFDIDAERTYRYVEIGSVNVSNGEISPSAVVGAELPANAKRVLKKGDVIVSKVRTYRGAVTIVEKNGYVGSGAFTILRENGRIKKETLLVFLHSKPLLAWSLKPNSGTSYPVIIDDDILNLPVPLLPEETQTEIQQKVIESFKLRKQSKHLLECAKQAVEMAIEQNESKAMEWLENSTNELTKWQ